MFLSEEQIKIVEEKLKPLGIRYSPSYFYNNWYSKFIHKNFPKKWVRKLFKIEMDDKITNFISKFGFDTTRFSDIIDRENEKDKKWWTRKKGNYFSEQWDSEYNTNILGHYTPIGKPFQSYKLNESNKGFTKYCMNIKMVNDFTTIDREICNFLFIITFYKGIWQVTSNIQKCEGINDIPDIEKILNDLIVDLSYKDVEYKSVFRETDIDKLLDC